MQKNRAHYRLTLGDALEAHKEALKTGGLAGIKSLAMIQSAIGRPYIGYDRSLSAKVAAFIQSMATNHGFNDGNKRTTLLLLNLLVRRSGYEFKIGSRKQLNDEIEWLILSVVGHHLEMDELTAWVKRRLTRQTN